MIDYTITIGNLIEIASIIGGGILVLLTLKNDVNSLKIGASVLSDDLLGMQAEIKKLGEILVNIAEVRGEIRVVNTRMTNAEQDIRELRHGQGFILQRAADSEVP
jgi:hypothetical protein